MIRTELRFDKFKYAEFRCFYIGEIPLMLISSLINSFVCLFSKNVIAEEEMRIKKKKIRKYIEWLIESVG